MAKIFKIRAHHLLCLQGYEGYGYSRIFEEHFSKILDLFQKNPGTKVEVVTENDLVCSKCPNAIGGNCRKDIDSDQKIRQMDLRVLKKLNLEAGAVDTIEKLLFVANTILKRRSDLGEICGSCQWRNKCRWFMSRLT